MVGAGRVDAVLVADHLPKLQKRGNSSHSNTILDRLRIEPLTDDASLPPSGLWRERRATPLVGARGFGISKVLLTSLTASSARAGP